MSMVRDADLSLANWLGRALPPDTEVRFDPPRAEWERRGRGPAFISAFLRVVARESGDLPRSGWTDARDADGRLLGVQLPPRYYRLSYLITAWAAAADREDEASRRTFEEHELLGRLIDACTNTEILDPDQLTGSLAEAGLPCYVRCAAAEDGRPAADPWSGLGIAPRTAVELHLVAAVVPRPVTELAPPVRQLVLRARQDPDFEASQGTDARTAAPGPSPARTPGTVRRWERTTIIEPTGESSGH